MPLTDWITAISTGVIGLFTVVLAIVTWRTFGHLKREFEATNRPWLSVEPLAVADLVMTHDPRPTAVFAFTLKNGGKTPATQVVVEYAVAPPNLDHLKQQKASAARGLATRQGHLVGLTVFPGIPEFTHIPFFLEPNELDAWCYWLKAQLPGGSALSPVYLVGCVTYRATYANRVYQTGFIRKLMASAPEGGARFPVDPREGDVAKDRIILGPSEAGDHIIT